MRHHSMLQCHNDYDEGISGRGLMTSLGEGKDRSFNKITANWVMTEFALLYWMTIFSFSSSRYCADRSIVGRWCVSNAAMTLATVSATSIPVLFFWRYALLRRTGTFFNVADTDVEMCKPFNLKKTLYDCSTVAQIAERFELNTVLWAFHTIQPSSCILALCRCTKFHCQVFADCRNCHWQVSKEIGLFCVTIVTISTSPFNIWLNYNKTRNTFCEM